MRNVHRLIWALFVVCAFLSSCTGESYKEKEAKREQAKKDMAVQKDTQRAQVLAEFSKTYNADPTWQKPLENKPLWTMTLRDSLVRADRRPIVASVTVLDVDKHGEQYALRLYAAGNRILEKQYIVFELKCAVPGFQFNPAQSGDFYAWKEPDYLVAALIRDVRTTQYMFEVKTQDSYGGLIEPLTEFVASGECLGLKYIGAEPAASTAEKSVASAPLESKKGFSFSDLLPKSGSKKEEHKPADPLLQKK